ncbi:MAG: hypothetical protein PF444_10115, partial [Bacteroidales bacterium]|nr:hypothetical protein [Bacteroidales bacterium]
FIDGTAVFSELSELRAEMMIKGNTMSFWETMKEVEMADLITPEIEAFNATTRTLTGVMAELNSCLTEVKGYTCFELINDPDVRPGAADVTAFNPSGMCNYYDIEAQAFVNESGDGAGGYKYNNTVFLRLYKAIDCVFEALGYEVEYNHFAQNGNEDIALINVFNLWSAPGAVSYGDLLPEGTVYKFLNDFRESGYDFNIDTAGKTVSIKSITEAFDETPTVRKNIIEGSVKQLESEAYEGYSITMAHRGAWNENEFALARDYGNLLLIQSSVSVATYSLLPDPSVGVEGQVQLVLSEGIFDENYHDNNGYWKRIKGFTVPYGDGVEVHPVVIDSPISAALSITVKGYYNYTTSVQSDWDSDVWEDVTTQCAYSRQRTIVNINTESDEDVDQAIILTVYRGMETSEHGVLNPAVSPQYPRASYYEYNTLGIRYGIPRKTITTSIFQAAAQSKIDLFLNCYPVQYKYMGSFRDMLRSSFSPLIAESQRGIVKQRSANIIGEAREIVITETVLIKQVKAVNF